MKTSIILATIIGSATAFTTHTRVGHRQPLISRGSSKSSLNMGGASGYATSLEGKQAKVATIQGLLDTSEMIFSVPASYITVSEVQSLRKSLPELKNRFDKSDAGKMEQQLQTLNEESRELKNDFFIKF